MRSLFRRAPWRLGIALALAALVVAVQGCAVVPPSSSSSSSSSSVPLSQRLFVMSQSGAIASIDAANGSTLWSYPNPQQFSTFLPVPQSQPARVSVVDGLVFASGTASGAPAVAALDAMTGAVRWQWQGAQGAPPPTAMVAAGSTVYLLDSANGRVIALDAGTGKSLWTAAASLPSALVADAHAVYVQDADGVVAFAAGTGQRLWDVPNASDPTVSSGAAYVLYSCGTTIIFFITLTNVCLGNFDATTGTARWSSQVTQYDCAFGPFGCSDYPGAPVQEGSSVFVLYTHYTLTGNPQGSVQYIDQRVLAYGAASGKAEWTLMLPNSRAEIIPTQNPANPVKYALEAADANAIYVQTSTGQLIAYSQSGQRKLWSYPTQSDLVTAQNGMVYVQRGSTLTALHASTGAQAWDTSVGP